MIIKNILDVRIGDSLIHGKLTISPGKWMHPNIWVAPIIWNGKLNGENIYFIQIDEEADDDCCFDFSMLDSKFKIFIPAIVEAIFDIQSCMD